MAFTNVFGGSPVQPATVSYRAITLSADVTLTWATSFVDTADVVARIMDVTPSAGGFAITLPDATEVSPGQDFLATNAGADSFDIKDSSGTVLQTIAAGQAFYFWLTSNSTAAGVWEQVQFGAGSSAADANALAGYGLKAIGATLNTNYPNQTINSNHSIATSDRAKLIVWNGGSGTVTLPTVVTATSGFYVALNNQGSGTITVQTSDGATIDGQASFSMNPNNSSFFICVGSNWNSLGYGQQTPFQVTVASPQDISAGGTINVADPSKLIQQFIGALAQNALLVFPAVAGQWYVYNAMSVSFTVSAKLNGVGSTVVIPQGGSYVLYSDGSSMYITATTGVPPTYTGQTTITTLGTITTGTWNGSTITVPYGGTGNSTFTAYSVICAGTTATGAFQNVVGVGTAGQVLTSAGAGALPAWQTPVAAATKGEQETGTSTTTYVSPGRQQFHKSAAKVWVAGATTGGTPSATDSFNVSSVTDNGVGLYTINYTTAFASEASAPFICCIDSLNNEVSNYYATRNAGSCQITFNTSSAATNFDPDKWSFLAFGNQ